MSQSLDRALRALTAIAEGKTTLNELAETLDVHRTTALRLLRTLERHRFVFRPDPNHYQLGSGLFALSTTALASRDIRQVAHPYLVKLSQRHGHTVHLAAYESGSVVYIDKVDSTKPVGLYSRIGDIAPLYCTAVGKLLLAAQPKAESRRIANSLTYTAYTDATITNAADLLVELDAIRAKGHATAKGEHEDFVHCVAAPITDGAGTVIAAASISVASMMLGDGEVERYLPSLLEIAREISGQYDSPASRLPTESVADE